MPYYSKPRSRRSVHWFYAILTIIAIGVLYWAYVLYPSTSEVVAEPRVLVPHGESRSEIRVVQYNRLGGEVPRQEVKIKCEIIQGRDLVELTYNENSSKAFVKPGSREGVVEIRVTSPELVLPQIVTLYIERPTA